MTDTIVISEEDMVLVHAIQLQPRASWAQLASVVGSSPNSVERRWRKLEQGGFAWTAGVANDRAAKDGALAYVEITCATSEITSVAQLLALEPEILTVDISTGRYDLFLTVVTSSLERMTNFIMDRINTVPSITHVHLMLSTAVFKSGTQWRMNSLSQRQIAKLTTDVAASPPASLLRPTSLDKRIRRVIEEDGRTSYSRLATLTGTSRNTVQRRLSSMLREGNFSIRCDIAGPAFGWPVMSWFRIDVSPRDLEEVGWGLASEAHIRLIAAVADQPNLLVGCWLRTVSDVPRFENHLLDQYPKMRIMGRNIDLYSIKRMGRLLDRQGTAVGILLSAPPES